MYVCDKFDNSLLKFHQEVSLLTDSPVCIIKLDRLNLVLV